MLLFSSMEDNVRTCLIKGNGRSDICDHSRAVLLESAAGKILSKPLWSKLLVSAGPLLHVNHLAGMPGKSCDLANLAVRLFSLMQDP